MGPTDPWSANWRPDPTGQRLARIRTARRGAVFAVIAYIPVAIAVVVTDPLSAASVVVAPGVVIPVAALLCAGIPGVGLLGAGLAPAALGSRIDAAVAGLAFAVGAPVAAVTSLVITGFIADAFVAPETAFALDVLRAGVSAAIRVAPLVALVAALWVIAVRRFARSPSP